MALGGLAGVGIGMALHILRVRSRWAVVAAGLCGWIALAGAFHWVEYRYTFVPEVALAVALDGNAAGALRLTDADALDAADAMLIETVGQPGFMGFVKLRARAGVRLRILPASLGTHAGELVWVVDLLIIFTLIMRITLGVSSRVPAPV